MSNYRKRGYSPGEVQVKMFDVGDIVRLKTGKSPQRVMEVNYVPSRNIIELRCMYLTSEVYHQLGPYSNRGDNKYRMQHCQEYRHPRDQNDFVLYDGLGGQKYLPAKWLAGLDGEELFTGEYEVAQDLYMVKASVTEGTETETNRFGTKLTVNSQGKYVLEMKGENGKVEAFDPDDLEVVLPYTIQLVGVGPGISGFHVVAVKDQFEKDDILIGTDSGVLYRVAEVDSKNRNPKTGKVSFLRIKTEKVSAGSDN